MKILHTADWHIGKKLHKQDLSKDFDAFVKWLCQYIMSHQIELILISGDIFDLANPSNEARKQYYETLLLLKQTGAKIIITGGNHDSPSLLNAPKDLLAQLDVHIIGKMPQNLEELIIPIKNKANKVELVVAAIPFLRNPDIQKAKLIQNYDDRLEAIRQGIAAHYQIAGEICQNRYPDIPHIAMGHLFAAGVSTSESERDIQIGNQAYIDATCFGNAFSYVALGHIHQPQKVKADFPIYYSGSPIQLSFSERKDEKRILVIDTEKGVEPESIPVPSFRKLIRLKGDLFQIETKLNQLESKTQFTSFIEIELVEDDYNFDSIQGLNELMENFNHPNFQIIKHRIQFKNQAAKTSEHFDVQQHINELSPQEIFSKKIESESFDENTKTELIQAFEEILEELNL
ncbi:MAG: exonuclease SbcCD subunit D C-terminal domain-containing protein [Bacteroidota bacterium]